MGWYCIICHCNHSNESFTGRGRKRHVCKKSYRLTKAERRELIQCDEIESFLCQSHISKKNIIRLRSLAASEITRVAELAAVVLAVATVTPYKRKRIATLARTRPDLIEDMQRLNLTPQWSTSNNVYPPLDPDPAYGETYFDISDHIFDACADISDTDTGVPNYDDLPF